MGADNHVTVEVESRKVYIIAFPRDIRITDDPAVVQEWKDNGYIVEAVDADLSVAALAEMYGQ